MARAESALDYDKLVKLVKSNKEITQGAAAQKLGLSIGQVSMLAFCQAKVEAGVHSKAPGTPASIKKLRDNEGNRWELIAARTGKSVAAVKAAYEEAGGNASASYTGRGRDHTNGSSSARKPAARRSTGTSNTRSSGRPSTRTATKPAARKPAGRRASGAATTRSGQAVTRRTTRRSSASNPS